MYSFWILFAVGIVFAIIVSQTILWIISNLESHTPEWREERLIKWLKRPLPTLDNRGKIMDQYSSNDWNEYPYLLIDAICHFEKGSDEVIKWAINYSTPDKFRHNDEEYLRVLLSV